MFPTPRKRNQSFPYSYLTRVKFPRSGIGGQRVVDTDASVYELLVTGFLGFDVSFERILRI